jgi:hypothetical protein
MSYIVLYSSCGIRDAIGGIWASLLIAVLSLTGIGWSTPGTWVESMGINCPDYSKAQFSANQIKNILNYIRKSNDAVDDSHIKNFVEYAKDLKYNIGMNLEIEPKCWDASKKVKDAMQAVDDLIDSVNNDFQGQEPEAFRVACKYEIIKRNSRTVKSLKRVEGFWPDWQSKKQIEDRGERNGEYEWQTQ